MTEEEAASWREERNARGLARKQARDEGRAKMEKVGGVDCCALPCSWGLLLSRAVFCTSACRQKRLMCCSTSTCTPTAQRPPPAPSRGPALQLRTPLQALECGQRIVLDLSFADLMREGELKSICSQLGYCWHANCGAAQPAHLVLTGVEVSEQALRHAMPWYCPQCFKLTPMVLVDTRHGA